MGVEGHLLKRIPRIKFPERHPKSSASEDRNFTGFLFLFENLFVCLIDRVEIGTPLSQQSPSTENLGYYALSGSNVPAPLQDTAVGGKASLLPKRTPVSDREIEAILALGGGNESTDVVRQIKINGRDSLDSITYGEKKENRRLRVVEINGGPVTGDGFVTGEVGRGISDPPTPKKPFSSLLRRRRPIFGRHFNFPGIPLAHSL
ncbi:hypothetical protein SDJN02_02544 [Cucurbita argyrosperma subsp. argyrosperma]|nr:hypothetical protein SDJN02_02544 [Cucurbita argyrosperma subsp. argyrosperma]